MLEAIPGRLLLELSRIETGHAGIAGGPLGVDGSLSHKFGIAKRRGPVGFQTLVGIDVDLHEGAVRDDTTTSSSASTALRISVLWAPRVIA